MEKLFNGENMKEEAEQAVKQIISKKYDIELKEKEIKDIIFVGNC